MRAKRTDAENAALKHEAAVLHIRQNMTLRAIAKQLHISTTKLQMWSNEGKWQDFRQETTHERKADERHQSAILYIKEGLLINEICARLNVSYKTVIKWRDAGRWDDLRPDLIILNQYKASIMFLQQGLTTGEIAMRLNVPEIEVSLWADVFGWKVSKWLFDTQDLAANLIDLYCETLNRYIPREQTAIGLAKYHFLKDLKPTFQPHELKK